MLFVRATRWKLKVTLFVRPTPEDTVGVIGITQQRGETTINFSTFLSKDKIYLTLRKIV